MYTVCRSLVTFGDLPLIWGLLRRWPGNSTNEPGEGGRPRTKTKVIQRRKHRSKKETKQTHTTG